MIYICYGMTKSASTFLYQLTEESFRLAGMAPVRLGPPFRPRGSVDNYFDRIDAALLQRIAGEIPAGGSIVLKTHAAPTPEVAERIADGEILASATLRDPREIALSMVDHGRRARRWRNASFAEIATPLDAFASLDNQVESCRRWAEIPGVALFLYNELCFETVESLDRLHRQIGLSIDAEQVMRPFRSRFGIGQFSKGVALRYREMPEQQQQLFLERYAAFYADFAFDTPTALALAEHQRDTPPRGELAQEFAYWVRRLRDLARRRRAPADRRRG